MIEPERSRGGHLVAQTLAAKNIDIVFTLSGGFINPIIEGLMLQGIRTVNAPHEQVAGHLADGWARDSRKPAVCLVGPEGFGNAVPAMLEAYGQRSPVIFITGSSTLKRRGQGGFKEVDHVRIAESLTKYSVLVTDGRRIPDFIDKAFEMALGGNPGPVHVSIPTDLLYSSYDAPPPRSERPFGHMPTVVREVWPDPSSQEELERALRASRRPLIVAGSGVWWGNAENELSELSEACAIPLLVVPYHQHPFTNGCKSYLGLADAHQYPPSEFALREADLIIAIGCRLDNMLNFGNPPLIAERARLVCVNSAPEDVAGNHAADTNVLGHPRPVLAGLVESMRSAPWTAPAEWLAVNKDQRKRWVEDLENLLICEAKSQPMHPLTVSTALMEVLGPGDYLVIDGGDTHYWAEMALNVAGYRGKHLRGVFHPGPMSLLGCGIPIGIALKLRHPEANVVVLSGDGAFLSSGMAIESSFYEAAPITVVIDNNRGLGSIRQQQLRMWDSGRSSATEFRDIPFDGLFRGLKGHGEMVEDAARIGPAIRGALASGVPACVNVRSRSVISPLVAALTDRRAKASIE